MRRWWLEKPWTVEDLDMSLAGEPVLARSYAQSAVEVFQAALSALGASGWHVHTVTGPQLGATAHRERVSELDSAALVVTDALGDGCVLTCRMRIWMSPFALTIEIDPHVNQRNFSMRSKHSSSDSLPERDADE